MRAPQIAGCLALVVVSAGAVPARSAIITVTTAADTTDPADGLTSLREAFAQASTNGVDDDIVLTAGTTYTLADCLQGSLDFTEATALDVQGNVSTIQQTCSDVGIVASTALGSSLTLGQVTLLGGPNSGVSVDGAAVAAAGVLALDQVTVTGVSTGPVGSVIEASAGHSTSPYRLTITGSSLHDNVGRVVSGDNPSVHVVSTEIVDNQGSAFSLVDGWPLVVESSTIARNAGQGVASTGQGFVNNSITVIGCTIEDNATVGITCSNCGTLVVQDSVIQRNGLGPSAVQRGGIHFRLSQRSATSPQVTISGSTIVDNVATEAGAGVHVSPVLIEPDAPVASTFIDTSTIAGNQTIGADLDGGGVSVTVGNLFLDDVVITDNHAGSGDAASDGGGLFFAEVPTDPVVTPYVFAMTGSTVDANTATGAGGGLHLTSDGDVTLDTVELTGNTAAGDGGGAAIVARELTIGSTRVSGNTGASGGGLLVGDVLTVNIAHSTIDGNTAAGSPARGGGIAFIPFAHVVTVEQSTIVDNVAGEGGGVFADTAESLEFHYVTMTGNAAASGAQVASTNAIPEIFRSLFAAPIGGVNCVSAVGTSSGGRSFYSDASCAPVATDVVSADDPELGPLADNGGPTPTRLPAATSRAGGLVPAAECAATVDQRFLPRPQGANCDAGAVEIAEAAAATIQGTPGPDLLVGTNGGDVIRGLGGNDLLLGGPGVDILIGGGGHDQLIGGPGPDLCFFPGSLLPRDC